MVNGKNIKVNITVSFRERSSTSNNINAINIGISIQKYGMDGIKNLMIILSNTPIPIKIAATFLKSKLLVIIIIFFSITSNKITFHDHMFLHIVLSQYDIGLTMCSNYS